MSVEVKYIFNGQNIKEAYGVHVSASAGLFGRPKRKYNVYTFPGQSGHEVDMKSKVYEHRVIKLSCFILSSSDVDLVDKYERFTKAILDITEYAALKVQIGEKEITRKVYVSDLSDLRKKWGENVGVFELQLAEPNIDEEADS